MTAAADQIFALFEATIAQYEEELRRCRDNQCANVDACGTRHVEQSEDEDPPQTLDMGLDVEHSPVDTNSWSKWTQTLDSGLVLRLDQDLPGSVQIKQEPKEPAEVKQEQDSLIRAVFPELSIVCGKSEEPQTQSTDPNMEDWTAPFSCSETEDGDKENTALPSSVFPQTRTANNTKRRRFQCQVCKRFLSTNCSLRAHLQTHTGEKYYGCSVCSKRFTTQANLRAHKRTHRKAFICPKCGHVCATRKELREHGKSHPKKPFGCSYCDKSFVYQHTLDQHVNTHHKRFLQGMKQFPCQLCNKSFVRKESRKKHVKSVHMGEAMFTCQVCGISFTSRFMLKNHSATHTGSKPFSCLFCDKGFFRKSDLIVHKKKHSGERPFSCAECGKKFLYRRVFNGHLEKHRQKQGEN